MIDRQQNVNLASFIWSVADLLRGPFKQSEYGRVILPFTVLRRLECVLEPTRQQVLDTYEPLKGEGVDLDVILSGITGVPFYNVSRYTLGTLGQTSNRANLEDYISKFSPTARGIFNHFDFSTWIGKLESANLLHLVAQRFASIDLHPSKLDNMAMGQVFEHLIYKFAEGANDTAGEHYTPRDVVRLTTTLVFAPDHEALVGEGIIRTVYDPTAGTGGFLSEGIELVKQWNPNAVLVPYSQELNPETYAIQVADKLIQGYNTKNLKLGNTLSDDQLAGESFQYGLSNPPYGADWKGIRSQVETEHKRGHAGRFGPGLPRVSDGSMLFLLHLLSKRRQPSEGGSRFGIVLSGSPLFAGGAGSGESEIRRWILENDLLEAIVGLPTDLFYNTGIATYVWILSNNKEAELRGKVQLIDATDMYAPMRKSLGNKRRYLTDKHIAEIARLHADFQETERSKIFETTDYGYRRITIERPIRLAFQITQERLDELQRVKFKSSRLPFSSQVGDNYFTSRIRAHLMQATLEPEPKRFLDVEEFSTYVRSLLDKNPLESFKRFPDDQFRTAVKLLDSTFEGATDEQLKNLQKKIRSEDVEVSVPSDLHMSSASMHLLAFFKEAVTLASGDWKFLLRWFGELDPAGAPVVKKRHRDGSIEYEADPTLRDYENVPLGEDVYEYFEREVLPHVPDAWIDETKRDAKDGEVGIVGYEIPFNRHFYTYTPPRPLEEIDADLRETTQRIMRLIEGLSA